MRPVWIGTARAARFLEHFRDLSVEQQQQQQQGGLRMHVVFVFSRTSTQSLSVLLDDFVNDLGVLNTN